ncbi:MAG: MBOAT family protein, partial [Planctomycetes bacterium]|nr:MBOAT family protein [Planctomycetota bacterium]
MIFPSYIFLLAFLPVVLVGWYGLPSVRIRLGFLTLASYAFYGWWDYRFTLLMLGSTLLDYVCGLAIGTSRGGDDLSQGDNVQRRRKFWLAMSIAGNLSALGFFKYYDFFAESLGDAFESIGFGISPPVRAVILPIGIS